MHKSKPEIVLPPITVVEDEARRLNALASSSTMLFPSVAHFLAQEMISCDLPQGLKVQL
jgi:regulator of nucleoside diphosphate kinase